MKSWNKKQTVVPHKLEGTPKEQAKQLMELLKDRTLSIEALKELMPMNMKVIEEFISCMKTELEANRTTYGKVIDSINASLDVLRGILKDGKIDEKERDKVLKEIDHLHEVMVEIHDKHEERVFDLAKWFAGMVAFIVLIITYLGGGKGKNGNHA